MNGYRLVAFSLGEKEQGIDPVFGFFYSASAGGLKSVLTVVLAFVDDLLGLGDGPLEFEIAPKVLVVLIDEVVEFADHKDIVGTLQSVEVGFAQGPKTEAETAINVLDVVPDPAGHEERFAMGEGVLIALCESERWIFIKSIFDRSAALCVVKGACIDTLSGPDRTR